MAIAKRTRKQIEKHITSCAESIQKNGLEIGDDLCEIRDRELWRTELPRFRSWSAYLKEHIPVLVDVKSFGQAAMFIRAAEVAKRLPSNISSDVRTNLKPSHYNELCRLAPTKGKDNEKGAEKDYSRLRKQDIARVLKDAGPDPSVRDIRKAVDDELGIDRKAEEAKAKATRERESQIDLDDYLSRIKGTSEGWLQVLEAVPFEAWEDYASEIDEAAKALESLFTFLRS